MASTTRMALLGLALLGSSSAQGKIDTDIASIQRSWGQISTYADNAENYFGVNDVGLPDGCQVEQFHQFQRHAQRFPTGASDDGGNDVRFATKIKAYVAAHPGTASEFTGPLSFLPSYNYIMSSNYLTGLGAATEVSSGVSAWNRYGRTVYNASQGQVAYDPYFLNGTARPKPVLRTTNESRIYNSEINWALGFFGTSFQLNPDPQLTNATKFFDVVVIDEGETITENNTLASYDSCPNDNVDSIGYIGDDDAANYAAMYLVNATKRLQQYVPKGLSLNTSDALAMQSICAYEYQYIGMSSFCDLFTADEWAGFEHSLEIEYYYDYSFGNPTGRAQGIGYTQELLARLMNQYITVGNTSVNSTIDNNGKTFPLGQPFYLDVSHDDIIVSILTSLSLDYFKQPPSLTAYPPNPARHFKLSNMTPFGARLVTEVIGCSAASPAAVAAPRVYYTPGQYGYKAANASHKFIRMRLNHGILPLSSIRGGKCAGRSDGLCALEDFLESQKNATALADYQYACFANYTIDNAKYPGKDYDGTIFPPSKGGLAERSTAWPDRAS